MPLLLMARDEARPLEAGTASGWARLEWGHVLFDLALIFLFMVFFTMMDLYLIDNGVLERSLINKYLAKAEGAIAKALTKAEEDMEKKAVSSRGASSRFSTSSRASSGRDSFDAEGGGGGSTGAATAEESEGSQSPSQRPSGIAVEEPSLEKPSLEKPSALENMLNVLNVNATVLPEFREEVDKVTSLGSHLEASIVVEACSIVVTGWGRGTLFPPSLYAAIVEAAGEEPRFAVQPNKCFDLTEAKPLCEKAKRRIEQLSAYLDEDPSDQKTARLLENSRADLDVANQSVATLTKEASSVALDYAFLTFSSSEAKAAVLHRVVDDTLLPEASLADLGIVINPAPNPTDVIWRSLEALPDQRVTVTLTFTLVMLLIALFSSASFGFTQTVGALVGCLTPFTGLIEIVLGKGGLLFGYFCVYVAIIAFTIQIMIQPIFCVYQDKGLCCIPKLRLTCCSYTTLFAAGGQLWMWFEFFIQLMVYMTYVSMIQKAGPGYTFSHTIVYTLGNLSSVDKINFYHMYNQEAQGNVFMAGLVETLFASWVLIAVPRYMIAPFQKKQSGMDYWVRMTNFAWLPFTTSDSMRVLAFTAVWCGVFPAVSFMMLLYYPIGIFVVRTNLLGRIEPGPMTKPLLHRYCFSLYLPFHLLIHLVLTFGIYSDVELPLDGSGGWVPGYNSHSFDNAPLTFHGVVMIGAVVVQLTVVPYLARARALREGVLTPWELIKLFAYGTSLHDVDFTYTTRVSVGVHHRTAPRFFGVQEGTLAIEHYGLPKDVPPDALFNPVSGVDLMKLPELRDAGLKVGRPSFVTNL